MTSNALRRTSGKALRGSSRARVRPAAYGVPKTRAAAHGSRAHRLAKRGAPALRFAAIALVALMGSMALATSVLAAEEGTDATFDATILPAARTVVLKAVEHVMADPEAPDAERAALWVLRMAELCRMESEVVAVAELAVRRYTGNRMFRPLADRVRCVGLAAVDGEAALAAFRSAVRSFRQPQAWSALDLAQDVASRAQVSGNVELAERVYEAVADRFLLNGRIAEVARFRIERLRKIGTPAPGVEAATIDGSAFDLRHWAGRAVIVDFWGTNCVPCLESFPALKMLHRELHAQGLEIVGISLDSDTRVVRSFQAQWKLPWPLIVDPERVPAWRGQYGVPTIPATFVLDRKHRIRYVDLSEADLHAAVRRLLDEPASE